MGQRDIASFFGKPTGSGAVQDAKTAAKPGATSAVSAKFSPAATKGASGKRAASTQTAAAPASAKEASAPAEAAASHASEPANGAAPLKVLRETNNIKAEVVPCPLASSDCPAHREACSIPHCVHHSS
jgi:hypothetical protein